MQGSPSSTFGQVHTAGLHECPGSCFDKHFRILFRMCSVTWIPPATDCHQLMLSSSAYYKLQLLPGLLICVGVLSVKHLGVDATHQHHLNTTGPLKYLPIVPTPDTSPQTFWILDCTMEQALLY